MAENVLLKAPRFRRVGMEKPPWMAEGACRGRGWAFFPPSHYDERPDMRLERELRAKGICGECSVVTECARYALNEPKIEGIWGGLTERERRVTLKAWNRSRRLSRAG